MAGFNSFPKRPYREGGRSVSITEFCLEAIQHSDYGSSCAGSRNVAIFWEVLSKAPGRETYLSKDRQWERNRRPNRNQQLRWLGDFIRSKLGRKLLWIYQCPEGWAVYSLRLCNLKIGGNKREQISLSRLLSGIGVYS